MGIDCVLKVCSIIPLNSLQDITISTVLRKFPDALNEANNIIPQLTFICRKGGLTSPDGD
jgi:hypothetical protein